MAGVLPDQKQQDHFGHMERQIQQDDLGHGLTSDADRIGRPHVLGHGFTGWC
jgi:hypothetical protein